MPDFSMEGQKAAFTAARLQIADELIGAGVATKIEHLTQVSLTASGEDGTALPIVAREPYLSDRAPQYDVDPILTDGYEYNVGYEIIGGRPKLRQLFPVMAALRVGEPILLQPEVFTPDEARVVMGCVNRLVQWRRERFPFLFKNLKEFML